MANVPYSAAPGGNFGVPRLASATQYHPSFLEDEDEIHDMLSQNQYNDAGADRPMTAAVDGARFSHQQTRMNANSPPFIPSFANNLQTPSSQAQVQAMQEMQMLQLEVMRLQVSYVTQSAKCNSESLLNSLSKLNNSRRAYKQIISPSLCVNRCPKPHREGTPAMVLPLPVLSTTLSICDLPHLALRTAVPTRLRCLKLSLVSVVIARSQ